MLLIWFKKGHAGLPVVQVPIVYNSEPQGGSSGDPSEGKVPGLLTPGLQLHRGRRAGTTYGHLRRYLAAISEIKKYPKEKQWVL